MIIVLWHHGGNATLLADLSFGAAADKTNAGIKVNMIMAGPSDRVRATAPFKCSQTQN